VADDKSETKRHILSVTVKLLEKTSSTNLRLVDVAKAAFVAVATIYYHFDSREQLIAEAQAITFLMLTEPLHGMFARAEVALVSGDRDDFWGAIGDHIRLSWAMGVRDDERGVLTVLRDVHSQPHTRRDFDQEVSASFSRFAHLLEEAKALGWVRKSIDARALIILFWAASPGQGLIRNLHLEAIAPERIRDMFLDIIEPEDAT